MKLDDYIKEHHDGNLSEFARAWGTRCDHVRKMVDGGYLIIDGELYSPVKKRVKGLKKCG